MNKIALWSYSQNYWDTHQITMSQLTEKQTENKITAPYSDSVLSSLSSHKGEDWIITRAPEASLQWIFFLSVFRKNKNYWANKWRKERETTQLSSILITFSFSSWNDSTLEEDSLPSDKSVILLLALFDEPSGEDLVLHSCRLQLFLTSELGDNIVPLLDCLHDIILIVCGRHLKLPDSAILSMSLLESDTLQTLTCSKEMLGQWLI